MISLDYLAKKGFGPFFDKKSKLRCKYFEIFLKHNSFCYSDSKMLFQEFEVLIAILIIESRISNFIILSYLEIFSYLVLTFRII